MIGQRIRELRMSKGLTLQEVATHVGVTRASVSKWEQGHTHPEFARLEQLAKLFGVPITHVVSNERGPAIRQLPVVDYAKYARVEDFTRELRRPSIPTFPTTAVVTAGAFFMRVESREVKNLWLTPIASGSLVLFDPGVAHAAGDLIYAHGARGDCHLLYTEVVEGERCYRAFIGNKTLYGAQDYLVVLGVAIESVLVTPLKHPTG